MASASRQPAQEEVVAYAYEYCVIENGQRVGEYSETVSLADPREVWDGDDRIEVCDVRPLIEVSGE